MVMICADHVVLQKYLAAKRRCTLDDLDLLHHLLGLVIGRSDQMNDLAKLWGKCMHRLDQESLNTGHVQRASTAEA